MADKDNRNRLAKDLDLLWSIRAVVEALEAQKKAAEATDLVMKHYLKQTSGHRAEMAKLMPEIKSLAARLKASWG